MVAERVLCRLAWLQFVQAALMTAITPAWQISFHGAAAGALVTTSLLLYSTSTWPLLGLLPLACCSRSRSTAWGSAYDIARPGRLNSGL